MVVEWHLPKAQRLAALRTAYERPHLFAFGAAVIGGTALAQLISGPIGDWAPPWSGAWPAFAWLLAALTVAVPWLDRRAILRDDLDELRRRFRWGSLVQGIWALWLAWICPFPMGLISFLFLVMTLHQDAPIFGVDYLRPFYVLLIPVFFGSLLVVDLMEGPGLLHAIGDDARVGLIIGSVGLLMEMLLVLFLWVQVGQQQAMAEARRTQELIQARLNRLEAEQAVLDQAGPFIQVGAQASMLLHDARNQMQVMVSSASLCQELLAEGLSDEGVRQAIRAQLDEMNRCALAMAAAITQVTSAIRAPLPPQPVPLPELVAQAEAQLSSLVQGDPPLLERALVEDVVYVGPHHAPILANLMANGLHHGRSSRLGLRAERSSPWYIALHVEDQGLDGLDREQALADIGASLDLSRPPAPRVSGQAGLGLGLRIIKILLGRDRGGLFAAPRAGERGIVVTLWLPRMPPEQIPPEVSTGEERKRA